MKGIKSSLLPALLITTVLGGVSYAKSFDVLFAKAKKLETGEKANVVLVQGGFADGIDVGMRGEVWSAPEKAEGKGSDDSALVGYVTIVDVIPHQAAGTVELADKQKVVAARHVILTPFSLTREEFIAAGRAAVEAGKYDRAVFCFDTAMYASNTTQRKALDDELRAYLSELRDSAMTVVTSRTFPGGRDSLPPYFGLRLRDLEGPGWNVGYSSFTRLFNNFYEDHGDKGTLVGLIDDGTYEHPNPADSSMPDVWPELAYGATPEYPLVAENRGISGRVWVKALVGKRGQVLVASVGRSSGSAWLDRAAVASAYDCRFKPAYKNGQPVEVWVTYKVDFRL